MAPRTYTGQGFQNEGSHLTIPRKGMETKAAPVIQGGSRIVALNYSPQGDGNQFLLLKTSKHNYSRT